VLNSIIANGITTIGFLACIVLAVVLGIGTSLVFSYKVKHTASLALTMCILPAAIALVIMLVNGNIGAGVAVAGAFTLVRFRSVPGTAREIAAIFVDMALGLACGMGYLMLAVIFFVIISCLVFILSVTGFGDDRSGTQQLKVTIPEDLDYNELFDDIFEKYLSSCDMVKVRTTNMGTLYELTYDVVLKKNSESKNLIDEIRCRNGNLNITLGRVIDKESL